MASSLADMLSRHPSSKELYRTHRAVDVMMWNSAPPWHPFLRRIAQKTSSSRCCNLWCEILSKQLFGRCGAVDVLMSFSAPLWRFCPSWIEALRGFSCFQSKSSEVAHRLRFSVLVKFRYNWKLASKRNSKVVRIPGFLVGATFIDVFLGVPNREEAQQPFICSLFFFQQPFVSARQCRTFGCHASWRGSVAIWTLGSV